MSFASFMTLIDMAGRENDPDLPRPPPEADVLARAPNHRGGTTEGPAPEPAAGASTDGKPIEKTISCVSCRKRKLKCDRTKPKCSTCTRLRHDCEYPERRRNLGSKRRNMKELEARLAQVETQLVTEQNKINQNATSASVEPANMEGDWNDLGMDMNLDMGDDVLLEGGMDGGYEAVINDTFDMSAADFLFNQPPPGPQIPASDFFSFELLELGLQEPLPPQEMMDELHQIYFDKYHPQIPFIHKYRYYTSLSKSPKFRPPVCLRYAMWAVAASLSDKYKCYEDLLYERARRYIQDAEMKGHGEMFVTIYHAQTWGLIATFEAKKTYFSRSWMSTGRMTRLTQMLGLYRLDIDSPEFKQILPPPRDWIELEERRRTFWAAYYGDRWASSGTGWPMLIQEDEIKTNLPCSELAFEQGVPETANSLAEALTPDGCRNLSPFAGVILSATLFGHNFQHLHKVGPEEHPEDLINGEFWKRHRRMDNVLSNTFMFLPDHLRLPSSIRNMNVVFLHMNIHASAICLHQAAILTSEKHALDKAFIEQSRSRCLLAAEEIANIMRMVCHVDPIMLHPWIGFCLYVSAGVFIKDIKNGSRNPNCLTNLEFLLSAMKSIGQKHSVTNHFTAQVELDMLSAGIGKHTRPTSDIASEHPEMVSLPINGLLPDRRGLPMTYKDLQELIPSEDKNKVNTLPRGSTSSPNSGQSPDVSSEQSLNWDSAITAVMDMSKDTPPDLSTRSNLFDSGMASFSNPQAAQRHNSQASNNTMQFPIRSSTPSNPSNTAGPGFPWPATGEIVGHTIDMDIAIKRPFGWQLPEDGSQSQASQSQSQSQSDGQRQGIDFNADIGGQSTWCPFTQPPDQG